jgi:isoleucyl-tRNA synthetase
VCEKVEHFVQDLSAWYVRRSRRRFWKSDWSDDKLSAYQTLYEVLCTLNQVVAPILVFVTEVMYKNLVKDQMAGAEESVHHNRFPEPKKELIDEALSERMAAVLNVTSLGRSARTESKLKVRQPLAEMRVVPGSEVERDALQRFADHILDELNIKKLTLLDSAAGLCEIAVKPNMKLVGPKYGRQVGGINKALASADAQAVAKSVTSGGPVSLSVDGETLQMEPAEITVSKDYGTEWAAAENKATVVLLDKRITPELKNEGYARDIVRNIQNLRKDSGLNIEDRIELALQTDSPELNGAIEAFKDYIAKETLTAKWSESGALSDPTGKTDVEIEGQKLAISLRRA